MADGLHPRVITEGFDLAKGEALKFLEQFKVRKEMTREDLMHVALTSLRTKLHRDLAQNIAESVVEAVLCIRTEDK